ncbi:ethanolamine utilization protein EutS [Escherichia coli]|uniref:Ethanolamine utilization protein EutS n=1 Tax=Escherichia coli TaxID=562 RepID=A0A376KRI3_ECOLX|nr:ethanolamine utilization protein EutS [Escherichia coli]
MDKERIIQGICARQTRSHWRISSRIPVRNWRRKSAFRMRAAIGIMTLTPGETAMIAGDLALKAADVHIGFLDRFSGALVIYGSVGAVEEALSQTVSGLGRLLNYTLCEMTKS